MSDLVKLLNESKNGYLSMCIRLLNLFEAEKGGGSQCGLLWVILLVFFFHFHMWHPTQILQLLLQIRRDKFAFKYIQTEDHRLYLDLII